MTEATFTSIGLLRLLFKQLFENVTVILSSQLSEVLQKQASNRPRAELGPQAE